MTDFRWFGREENGGELPERPVYPYMNIRNRVSSRGHSVMVMRLLIIFDDFLAFPVSCGLDC
jgi:hypothetical protein